MLESVKITRRQSEIRQALAGLVGKETPTEDETRSMGALDLDYRNNETRYRAALIAEDTERRDAGAELETRSATEWAQMMAGFELRQVALNLDEGRQLDGRTAEIVQELRQAGGFRGIPVPWQALEQRAGETIAGGTPAPVQQRPIIDRLFPDSVASRMGAQMISIPQGSVAWPVTTSTVSAGWATSETGNVAGPTAYAATDRALSPDHNLGIQMRITRKALAQSGAALEQAIRRDMSGAMGVAMDKAVFLGTGIDGQPLGVITGAATYGITSTAINDAASWAVFRAAVVRFMTGNAAGGPDAIKAMIRPELWSFLDDALISGTSVSEWDRLVKNIPTGNIAMTTNGLHRANSDRWRQANYLVQVMVVLLNHARLIGFLKKEHANPAKGIPLFKQQGDGWEPWPDDVRAEFEAVATPRARLIYELCIGTGQRIGDVLKMRWDHIGPDGITVMQGKTDKGLTIPLTDRLAAFLATLRKSGLTIVTDANGSPAIHRTIAQEMRTVKGKMQHPSAKTYVTHGLRKNATIELYQAGCRDELVKAVTGHSSTEMLKKYGGGSPATVIGKGSARCAESRGTEQGQNVNVSTVVSKPNYERAEHGASY